MDGTMSARLVAAGIVLIGAVAAPAAAQGQAMVSLADVARQAEAAKVTQAKAKKSYTNSDLHGSAVPQAVAAADVAKVEVSANAKVTASEEMAKTGGEKA